jgi:hypothetical protein
MADGVGVFIIGILQWVVLLGSLRILDKKIRDFLIAEDTAG